MFGLTGVIVGGTSVVALGGLLATGYVKAPTDKAYIISGLRKEPRVVIGKATIKVPFLGNVREIVGSMKLEEMVKDRQKFAELVKENAEPDLKAMGLEIISFNVQNFIDDNGVIENLGIDNIVSIKKNAEISKANSEKEIAKARAMARKEANDAQVESEQSIAIKNNELALKKADLRMKEDAKKAQADAAYEIEQEQQRKTLETVQAEANIIRQEKAIEIKEKEALVREKELEANIRKQADADTYRRMKDAEAKAYEQQKIADVEQYKAIKEYEILREKANAELVAEQKKAEGISAVGEAEAKAIKAKLLAEAEGLDRKAEAMSKMQQAAVIEMIVDKLPEIVKNAASPLSNVDSITMYGEGNSAKLVEDVMMTTGKIMEGIEGSTGLNIKALLAGALGGKMFNGNNDLNIEKIANQVADVIVESDML